MYVCFELWPQGSRSFLILICCRINHTNGLMMVAAARAQRDVINIGGIVTPSQMSANTASTRLKAEQKRVSALTDLHCNNVAVISRWGWVRGFCCKESRPGAVGGAGGGSVGL